MKQLSKILFSPLRFLCWEAAHGWRERMLLLYLQSWRKACQAFRKPLCSWIQTLLGEKDATFWKPHSRGSCGMRSFLLHQPRAHRRLGKLCHTAYHRLQWVHIEAAMWFQLAICTPPHCSFDDLRTCSTTCQQSLKEAKQEKIKWYPQLRIFCAGGTRQATLV